MSVRLSHLVAFWVVSARGRPTEGRFPSQTVTVQLRVERASGHPPSRLLVAKTKHSHCRKPSGAMDTLSERGVK